MTQGPRLDADQVKAAASGQWESILHTLAGLSYHQLRDVHQPCPGCGGRDRFRYDNERNEGTFFCGGGGDGREAAGDGLALLQHVNGWTFQEALQAVAGLLNLSDADAPAARERPAQPAKDSPRKTAADEWVPVLPVPDEAPPLLREDGSTVETYNPKRQAAKTYHPGLVFDYRGLGGELLGHVIRMDLAEGDKWTPGVTYCEGPEGVRRWCVRHFTPPRPLYGLERLNGHSTAIIVEGEKAADAGQRLLGDAYPVLSWPGGSKAVHLTKWATLAGCKAAIWPDAVDGYAAVEGHHDRHGAFQPGAAQLLREAGCQDVRVVEPPTEAGKGWDLADAEDEGWSGEDVLAWIRGNVRPPADPEPEPEAAAEPEATPPMDGEAEAPPEDAGPDLPSHDERPPFVPLGYDEGYYYYLPRRTQQIVAIPAAGHGNKATMLSLAPLQWWEIQFPAANSPVDWTAAADACMRRCEQAGTFDPERVRGRGAWYDQGRSVLHLGRYLLVDGQRVEIIDHQSPYIYEAKAPMESDEDVAPAGVEAANQFVVLAKRLHWERPINALLFSGWAFLAPICGALDWRPHIWITGARASGKSWVINGMARPVLGHTAVIVQSTTTEAGIRQKLRQDARPVVFDEAEAENKQGQRQIQGVIELARQASSESTAEIAKGTTGGKAMSFRVRSMFGMGSINVPITQAADASRFSILNLNRPPKGRAGAEEFANLEAAVAETLTPEYCSSLRARAYRMIPTIRTNAATFARAAAEHIGSQRSGDQLGTLLAGAYALHSNGEISLDAAREWVQAQDWAEAEESEAQSDEQRCLSEILLAQVRVEGDHASYNRTLGELAEIAAGVTWDTEIQASVAAETLTRYGLRVHNEQRRLLVAQAHPKLREILADTPWAAGWVRILERVDGADRVKVARFAGRRDRAVSLPLDQAVEGPAAAEEDEDETGEF